MSKPVKHAVYLEEQELLSFKNPVNRTVVGLSPTYVITPPVPV